MCYTVETTSALLGCASSLSLSAAVMSWMSNLLSSIRAVRLSARSLRLVHFSSNGYLMRCPDNGIAQVSLPSARRLINAGEDV